MSPPRWPGRLLDRWPNTTLLLALFAALGAALALVFLWRPSAWALAGAWAAWLLWDAQRRDRRATRHREEDADEMIRQGHVDLARALAGDDFVDRRLRGGP